ncbi:hypothetical protein [Azotosporobacter soli]|uniref:hypothetical protein n=1 Tax=Azotosporobacter soli TaxID=3055040 RepID=UPI0031FE886F
MKTMQERRGILQKAVIETIENMSLLEGGCCVEEPLQVPLQKERVERASLTICSPQYAEFQVLITKLLLADLVQILYGAEKEEVTQDMENEVLADILNAVAEKVLQTKAVKAFDKAKERIGGERESCSVSCRFEQEEKILSVSWHQPKEKQASAFAKENEWTERIDY